MKIKYYKIVCKKDVQENREMFFISGDPGRGNTLCDSLKGGLKTKCGDSHCTLAQKMVDVNFFKGHIKNEKLFLFNFLKACSVKNN
jgi:hypothetical protein